MLQQIDPQDVIRLQARYQTNPNLFNDEQVRELMMLSEAAGMSFKPKDTQRRVSGNIIGNAVNALTWGATDLVLGEDGTAKFFGGGDVYGGGAKAASTAAGLLGLVTGGAAVKAGKFGLNAVQAMGGAATKAVSKKASEALAKKALEQGRGKAYKAVVNRELKTLSKAEGDLFTEGMKEQSLYSLARKSIDDLGASMKKAETNLASAQKKLASAKSQKEIDEATALVEKATQRRASISEALDVKASGGVEALQASSRAKRGLPSVATKDPATGKIKWSYADAADEAASKARFDITVKASEASKKFKPKASAQGDSGPVGAFAEKLAAFGNTKLGTMLRGDGTSAAPLARIVDDAFLGATAAAGFDTNPIMGALGGGALGGIQGFAAKAGLAGRLGLAMPGAAIGAGTAGEDSAGLGALVGALSPFMVGKALKNAGKKTPAPSTSSAAATAPAGNAAASKSGVNIDDLADEFINKGGSALSKEDRGLMKMINDMSNQGKSSQEITQAIEQEAARQMASGTSSSLTKMSAAERAELSNYQGLIGRAQARTNARAAKANLAKADQTIASRLGQSGASRTDVEAQMVAEGVTNPKAVLDTFEKRMLQRPVSGSSHADVDKVFDEFVLADNRAGMTGVQKLVQPNANNRSLVVDYHKGVGERAGAIADSLDEALNPAWGTTSKKARSSAGYVSRGDEILKSAAKLTKGSKEYNALVENIVQITGKSQAEIEAIILHIKRADPIYDSLVNSGYLSVTGRPLRPVSAAKPAAPSSQAAATATQNAASTTQQTPVVQPVVPAPQTPAAQPVVVPTPQVQTKGSATNNPNTAGTPQATPLGQGQGVARRRKKPNP